MRRIIPILVIVVLIASGFNMVIGFEGYSYKKITLITPFIRKIKQTQAKISKNNPFYKILFIFLYAWYAIILAYLFTWDFFTLRIKVVIFMSLLLGFIDFILREINKNYLNLGRNS